MTIRENDAHIGRFLIVEHGEETVDLDMKLIDSLDNRYILRPVMENREDGVLKYNISACESIEKYLVNRRMDRTELVGFLAQLKSVIRALEDHMLTDANILFDPQYVYIDRATRKVRFVPVCAQEGGFGNRLRPLIEELFRHADTDDTDSLRFAAGMMKKVMEKDLKMHTLMELAEIKPPAARQEVMREERRNESSYDSIAGNGQPEGATVLLSDIKESAPGNFPVMPPVSEPLAEETTGRQKKGFFSNLAFRLKDEDDDDE